MPFIFGKNKSLHEKIKFSKFYFFVPPFSIFSAKKGLAEIVKKIIILGVFSLLFFLSFSSHAFAADRYWIGDSGNWSDTAHWSNTDGGSEGFSVPTSADNVYFSAGSFSSNGAIVTLDIPANVGALDSSTSDQTFTITSSVNSLSIYGNITEHVNNSLYNFTGTAYFYIKGNSTITTNGRATHVWNKWFIDGEGITVINADDFSTSSYLTLLNGTWNTNSKTIVMNTLVTRTGTNSLIFGASTITLGNGLQLWSNTTVDSGTSTLNLSGDWMSGAGKTFYNINWTSSRAINGSVWGDFTANNLTINGWASVSHTIPITANITVNNNLTITGTNSTNYRVLLASKTIGTQRTITVDPAKVTASNVDFRDIKFVNPVDLSGISGGSGDAGGNSGITFTPAQPQYFKHTSGAVNWSDSTKWFSDSSPRTTPGRVPLPQDDVYFDADSFTGTSTLTVNAPRIGRSLDMSAVNQAVTMTLANAIEVYGSYVLGNNITLNGNYRTVFMGIDNFTINTYGKSMYNLAIYRGFYTMMSNLVLTASLSFYIWGTLDLNDYNLTVFSFDVETIATCYFGNGITTITSNSSPVAVPIVIYGTIYPEESTIIFNPSSGGNTNLQLHLKNKAFNKIRLSGTHIGTFDFMQSSTITELIVDAGQSLRFTTGTTTNIGNLTALGTADNPITISSVTGATHTLNFTGTGNVVADYLNLSYSTATPANKWYASHSTDGGNNSGWIFADLPDAPTGLTPTAGNTEVSLSWTVPADNGTAITDYVVDYKLHSDSVWSTFADGVSDLTTANITGLTNRSLYDFRVSAVNGVGQGNASVTATATPADPLDRYWVGGAGNWSDTAHWSNTDGGSGGYSVPTSSNDVYFSAGSFSADGAIVTIDTTANTANLDFSTLDQTMTLTSSVNSLNVYGSLSLSTKLSVNFGLSTAYLYFKSTSTGNTITSNGNTSLWNRIYFDGVGGGWINQDDWNMGYTDIYLKNGAWNTNDKTISLGGTLWTLPGTKSLILGSSLIKLYQLYFSDISNFIFDPGTSTIEATTSNSDSVFNSTEKALYNVTLIGTNSVSGYRLDSNFIINNNLILRGNSSTQRLLIATNSSILGTQRTITVDPAKVTASNVDFRDIKFVNPVDLSGISGGSGDAGGNSGITFTLAQPQYFKHTSGAVNWSDSTKWFSDSSPRTTPGRVPLPQDDATFDASSFTGTSTLTIDVRRIGKNLDMSAVNQIVTISNANNIESYGNFILGNNIIPCASAGELYLYGRGTFDVNFYGKTIFTFKVGKSSTYNLLSDVIITRYFNPLGGTINLNSYTLTFTDATGDAGYFYSEGIINAGTSTIKLTPSSGSNNIQFRGGGKTYNKIWLSGVHTGNFNITGSNTISELKIDAGKNVKFTAGTTTNINKLTTSGTLTNPITISSITAATHTLNNTGSSPIVVDYANISYSNATPANTWYASHSTDGGNNSGWIFANAPDAPTAVGASGGNALANLTWSAPAYDGGTAIIDYVIEYKLTSEPTVWNTFADGVSTNTTGTVTGLSNGSSYDFRISAVNAIGQGSASTIATTIPITVPNAPTAVVATRGNAQASIAFSAPVSDGGSPITSYTVTSNPGSQTATGSTSPIIVTGLTNGTEYTFTVTATNAAGTGPASSATNPVTPATVPDAPTSPVAVALNAEVSLSWTSPVWNGGTAITDYVIEYKLSSEPTVWSTFADGISIDTDGIVTGLTNALSYDFRIYAVNDVGQGSASLETSAMPITVPDAPTAVSGIAGNAQATISFTPPVFDGGSTINNYTVTSNPGNFTASGSTSPITITGLTNGTQYTFTVVATNSVGDSLPSTSSPSITPVTVPDAPTAVIATEGNRQATVAFTPPAFDGGTPITNYTATSTPGNFTGTSSSSPITVTGLTNGTTYTFTVKATNSVGTGGDSSPSNEVTLSTEPSQPVNLASTVLGSSIGLSWSAPVSNGGSAIVDYVIEYQLSTGGTWAVFAEGLNTNTTATVIGLSNRVSYDFRVIAVNTIGQSLPSDTTTATPGEPAQVIIQNFSNTTVPDIITNIRITNEGTSEYEYQYTWCITSSAENLCGGGDDLFSATAAKLVDHGENYDVPLTSTILVPGDYYFHIKVLYGSESSNAYQSFTALATFPNIPLSVSALAGNAQASVSFSEPSFDGGSSILNYTATSNPGGLTGTGSSSPIIVTGLSNGTEYTFTVTATNAIGTSSPSLESNSVIPMTVPDAPTGVSGVAGNSQVTLSWIAPTDNGGSSVTDYIIEYKLTNEPLIWTVFADGTSTSTSATINGLTNNLSYDFRVSAVNVMGQSEVNTTNITLPEVKKQRSGGSSGSSVQTKIPATDEEQNLETPEENINILKEDTNTTNKLSGQTPTKSSTTKDKNTSIDKNPNDNQITIIPTENKQVEQKVTETEKTNENTNNIWKIILIISGGAISLGLIILIISRILIRRAKILSQITEVSNTVDVPNEPERKEITNVPSKPRRRI